MKNKTGLREALEVILDAVDYKEGNCLPTQMVGGVLPSQLIDNARKTLAEESEARLLEKAELSLAELALKRMMSDFFIEIDDCVQCPVCRKCKRDMCKDPKKCERDIINYYLRGIK